jgi:hypothetical protein
METLTHAHASPSPCMLRSPLYRLSQQEEPNPIASEFTQTVICLPTLPTLPPSVLSPVSPGGIALTSVPSPARAGAGTGSPLHSHPTSVLHSSPSAGGSSPQRTVGSGGLYRRSGSAGGSVGGGGSAAGATAGDTQLPLLAGARVSLVDPVVAAGGWNGPGSGGPGFPLGPLSSGTLTPTRALPSITSSAAASLWSEDGSFGVGAVPATLPMCLAA